jgi:ATP-dependent Clp protease ATP-binding subunit ClpA
MFERYTTRARRSIFVARYEAAQLGATEIDPEHLLLGLIRESHHLLRSLPRLDYIDQLRNDVLAITTSRETNPSLEIPLSMACKRALLYATEEADALGHKNIGTEHLFLGLLREPDSVTGKLCQKYGAELTKARQLLMTSDVARIASPSRLSRSTNIEPEGCIAFVEANSGERVGITGLTALNKVPREGEFVMLDDYHGKPCRFRVVEVVYHFHREPPQAAASAHHLFSITIRVLQILPRATSDVDST